MSYCEYRNSVVVRQSGWKPLLLPTAFSITFLLSNSVDTALGSALADNSTLADNSVVALQPELGSSRLFISAKQRAYIDNLSQIEVDSAELSDVAVVKAPVVVTQLPVAKPMKKKVKMARLDGLAVRPGGQVDVWVNGSLINKQSTPAIKVLRATASGPVVLAIEGRTYSLYPGQFVRYSTLTTQLTAHSTTDSTL